MPSLPNDDIDMWGAPDVGRRNSGADDLGRSWLGAAVVENDEAIAWLRIARHIGAEVASVAHYRDDRGVGAQQTRRGGPHLAPRPVRPANPAMQRWLRRPCWR